jgi:uncharacterized protein
MITYVDTSALMKLLIEDEVGREAVERIWLESDFVISAEIGYVEARAALAAAHRGNRLADAAFRIAKVELDALWAQIDVVSISEKLVRSAGDLAELEGLRGYDAVHLAAAISAATGVFACADHRLMEAAARRGMATMNPAPAAE